MSIFRKGGKCKNRSVAIVGEGINTRKELHAIATKPKKVKAPAVKKTKAEKKATKKKTKK